MTSTRSNQASNQTLQGAASPDGLASLANPFFEAQRVQWEALLSWHQSVASLSKDFWEEWAVHYAGGLPIDG